MNAFLKHGFDVLLCGGQVEREIVVKLGGEGGHARDGLELEANVVWSKNPHQRAILTSEPSLLHEPFATAASDHLWQHAWRQALIAF